MTHPYIRIHLMLQIINILKMFSTHCRQKSNYPLLYMIPHQLANHNFHRLSINYLKICINYLNCNLPKLLNQHMIYLRSFRPLLLYHPIYIVSHSLIYSIFKSNDRHSLMFQHSFDNKFELRVI